MEPIRSAAKAAPTRSWWLYGLVVIPGLTDIVETGGLPRSARGWLTEVVAGC